MKIKYTLLVAALSVYMSSCNKTNNEATETDENLTEATEETVAEPNAGDEWEQLFNGENFEGWTHVGDGEFVIEEGVLKTTGGMGLLFYNKEKIENATIKLVYKNPGGKNSGVYIRIPEVPTEPWMPVHKGYEVQIDDRGDDYHVTGVLYSFTAAKARPTKADEWNTMEITIRDTNTQVHVNGVLVTDYNEGEPVPERHEEWEPERGPRSSSGYFGLQNHADEDVVYFKEISLKKL
ncbi:MAG: DUF1080 domain-containing protein [Cyclobacteriaceae bacterium]|nr:DUF1080 domain-containing protein [Cyclobacteriaceae bacterium]